MTQVSRNILIASGGTGGHIFPAIVFGKNLQENGDNVKWLCGSRNLELTIYESAGITPEILPIAGSPMGTKSPVKVLGRIRDLLKSITMTSRLIKDFTIRPRHRKRVSTAVMLYGISLVLAWVIR